MNDDVDRARPSRGVDCEEIAARARARLSSTRRPGQRIGLIWAAVSEDKGQTPEGQVEEVVDLVERMNLYVPPEHVFVVQGSRFVGKVPVEKKEVMELARRRRFDVLATWKLDRWSRDRKEGAREVYEILAAFGVTVVSIQESFLTTDGIPPFWREQMGRLIFYLSEQESKDKSERTKLKYRTKSNRAAALGERARWGRGHIATPEDRARVAKLGAKGVSLRDIERETGIPKSTAASILSESSAGEGRPVEAKRAARPKGALRTGRGGE